MNGQVVIPKNTTYQRLLELILIIRFTKTNSDDKLRPLKELGGISMAVISVPQDEANNSLQNHLESGKKYTYQEVKEILKRLFEGINDNQCSGLIHRAHSKTDGVLVKIDKYYQLRATATTANNGLEEAKRILEDALRGIELIPVKHFKTAEQFTDLIKLKEEVYKLIK